MITSVIRRKRPRRPVLLLLGGGVAAAGLVAAVALALVTDSGTCDVTVADKSVSSADCALTPGGAYQPALVKYIGSSAQDQASGTGLFEPFLRLQGGPVEKGYNTNGPVAFDTKSGTWTHAILVDSIPVVTIGGVDYWELFVDINENNTAKRVSLNDVEVWFTTNPNLVGFVDPGGFPSGATKEYDFSGNILINDVNQGSGRGDLRYLIPTANHTWDATTYFVLYSKWGTTSGTAGNFGSGGYASDGGFEEWKVRKVPVVHIVKTANPAGTVTAGSNIGFDITISNSGLADATGVTITDNLPPGPVGGDLNWSLSPAFPGCSISGNPGSQVLNCSFATLAVGGHIGPIHLTSPTTGHDCAVVNNTGTVSATNDGTDSDSDSVTVQCPDVTVVKTPDSEAAAPGTVTAGSNAVFTIVTTNNGPGTATAVTLTDVLPAGSWTVGGADAASCSGSNPHAGGSTLTCNFGSVAAGGSRTITLTYATVADDCARSGGTGDIDNTANVSASNEDASKTGSSSNGNNSDHGDVVVQCPDITVVKTPDSEATGPGTVKAGSDAVFTITVTNHGPGTATAVTLTDVLPGPATASWAIGGADYSVAACGASPQAGLSTLTCNFGSVAAGASKTITLTYTTVPADCQRAGSFTGDIDNTANVSATNEDPALTGDSANGSNSDHGDVHVQCAAIQILKESTKTSNPLVSVAGAVFHVTGPNSYAIDVTDNGANDEDLTTGSVCISGLTPGEYTVTETTPPDGYGSGTAVDDTATAADPTDCGANKPSTANSAVFTDPPLYSLQVNFKDGGSGETSATISCSPLEPPDSTTPPTGWGTSSTYTDRYGTYPQTVTCTIVIDP